MDRSLEFAKGATNNTQQATVLPAPGGVQGDGSDSSGESFMEALREGSTHSGGD